MRRLRIDRQRDARLPEPPQDVRDLVVHGGGGRERVVVDGAGARLGLPEAPGGEEVPRVDEGAGRPGVVADAAERVVELVAHEHRGDAELLHLVQALVDVRARASRDAVDDAAAERLRRLDAEDDGEFAVLDDPAGLGGVAHDAEPALPGAAVLRVDVRLHLAHALRFEPDDRHLVARVALERVQLAQLPVRDQVVDEDALPGAPGALQPRVVDLLVGAGVVGGPVLERRPAGGVVRPEGGAVPHEVLEPGEHPVRGVVGAVAQRLLDAALVERLAAEHLPAERLVRHQVAVGVEVAAHRAAAGVRGRDGADGEQQGGDEGEDEGDVEGDGARDGAGDAKGDVAGDVEGASEGHAAPRPGVGSTTTPSSETPIRTKVNKPHIEGDGRVPVSGTPCPGRPRRAHHGGL